MSHETSTIAKNINYEKNDYIRADTWVDPYTFKGGDLPSSLKRPIFPLLPLVVQMAICFKLAIVGSSIKTSKIRFLSLSSFV